MNENNNRAEERLKSLLNEAHPSEEANEALGDRLVQLEREARIRMKEQTRRPGGGRKFALVGGLLLTVMAVAAYQYFFNRPGEAAIGLIPADADVVFTMDLSPSQNQVATFAKIAGELKANGLDDAFDKIVSVGDSSLPILKDIRPHLATSFATAVWNAPDKKGKDEAVVFLALKDKDAVELALESKLNAREANGLTIFSSKEPKAEAVLIGDYLVVAETSARFAEIGEIHRTKQGSVANLSEYVAARAALPADSNIMVFVSPDGLKSVGEENKKAGVNPLVATEWMAAGLTVREDGLAVHYQCPINSEKMQSLKNLANAQPLDPSFMKRLPDGAVGVVAYSQPGKLYGWIEEAAGENPDGKKEFDKGMAEMEQELGIDFRKEILPAFDGQVVVAGYGTAKGGDDVEAEGLVVFTPDNGAQPAKAAQLLREKLIASAAKDKHKLTFKSTVSGSATVWEAVTDSKDEIPLHAEIDGALVIASGRAMMNKALAAAGGARTMADDIAMSSMWTKVGQNSQLAGMISLRRLMELIPDEAINGEDGPGMDRATLLKIFGSETNGLVFSGRYDGKTVRGEAFLPLDYSALIKVMADAAKPMTQGMEGMPFEGMPKEFPGEKEAA